MRRRAFTLIELMVSVAIIALLVGILAPALGATRESARTTVCLSKVRQLGIAWTMYAGDFEDRCMPLAYFEPPDVAIGTDLVFWFGSDGRVTGRVDHNAGFLSFYLDDTLRLGSGYECPSERWGTYEPQGSTGEVTTTFGYNGYGLCPPKTPGWGGAWGPIGDRPWLRVSDVQRPSELLVFGDSLLPVGDSGRSTALLDPPELYEPWSRSWRPNQSPTTSFRHGGDVAVAGTVDGSARARVSEAGWIVAEAYRVGSIGVTAGPRYVERPERWK